MRKRTGEPNECNALTERIGESYTTDEAVTGKRMQTMCVLFLFCAMRFDSNSVH